MKKLIELIMSLFAKPVQQAAPAPLNPPAFDPKLLEAWLRRAVDKKGPPPFGYEPGEGLTYCNYFVKDAVELYGYKELSALTPGVANQIADFVSKSSHWTLLKDKDGKSHYEAAANWASQGCLVMAAQQHENHGHVCVLIPDTHLIFSNKWLKTVPLCASVGKTNFYGKGLNWAFETEPDLYLLNSLPTGQV